MTPKEGRESQQRGRQILAANMWAIYNFDDPNLRYERFLSRGRPALKSFIESVLLYDKVIVPTQDFVSLTILVGVLGEEVVLDLLSAGSLGFLRVNGAFCYVGNGGGMKPFEMASGPHGPPCPLCAPLNGAISWALGGLTKKPKDPLLAQLALDATTEMNANSVHEEIRHETYMDVLDSTYLRNQFAIRNTDMDHLAGIGPKGVRIYGGPDADAWKGDEIDTVLLLAQANTELRLLDLGGCGDLTTSNPVGHVLKGKAQRTLGGQAALQAFTVLQDVARVPDIGKGVLSKEVHVRDLLRIKQSRSGEAFREWFHSHCRGDTKSIAKEYIDLLERVPKISSLGVRTIRFILTTLLGAIPGAGPVLGPAAAGTDSFFIQRWLRGSSPKLFIEDLKQVSRRPR